MYDNSWGNSFNLALADDSAGGSSLSSSEIASIVSPLNSTRGQLVERFLLRWNKTMTAWEDGTLASLGQTDGIISYNVIMSRFEQFKTDTQNAKQVIVFECLFLKSETFAKCERGGTID